MTDVLNDFMQKMGTLADEPTNYWDNYETQSTPNFPLDPGLYVLQFPAVGDDFKPDATKPDKDGKSYFQWSANLKATYPSAFTGRKLNYARFSVKKSPYREGSQAGDLIKAVGIPATPRTNAEWLAVTPMLAGQEVGVELDLQVYDAEAKKVVFKKSTELLKNADGKFKTRYIYVNGVLIHNPSDPEAEKLAEQAALDKKAQGGPAAQGIKVLYANNQIARVLPAAEVRELRADS